MICEECPRNCGIDRSVGRGFCNSPETALVSRAEKHFWEEPPISGKNGAGTIFFSGCNMQCAYCQNMSISRGGVGRPANARELSEIIRRLEGEGAHNIEFVTPTHYTGVIMNALDIYRPTVPVVYNCGGYEKKETVRKLEGYVDVYLPDMKYSDNRLAGELSKAPDYFETAAEAITEMRRQKKEDLFGADGLMKEGLIVRHLILPGHVMNTIGVLRWISENLKGTLTSVMSQYTPVTAVKGHSELSKKVSRAETDRVAAFLEKHGISGWIQDPESSGVSYIPEFDTSEYKY